MSLSLGKRISLAFSGLLVLVLGIVTGIIYVQGNRIAERSVVNALENIRDVQKGFEAQRFQQLILVSYIFASEPHFSSYIAEATSSDLSLGYGVDADSIVDLLVEHQQKLGFDIAMVLDDTGKIIARTDDQKLTGEDISTDSIVGSVIESLKPATGYWFRDEEIFQIAVIPLTDEQDLIGFLLTGLLVDKKFIEYIKNISGSELVFLIEKEGILEISVGTLNSKSLKDLLGDRDLIKAALNTKPVEIKLDNKLWLASVNHTGNIESGGITIALTSLDEALVNFRAMRNVLLVVIGFSLLLTVPLSFFISRRVLVPVRNLASAAQAAAHGDCQARFDIKGNDELAHLTEAFDILLSDLREKDDMQNYMTNLAKYLPEETLELNSGSSTSRKSGQQHSKLGVFSLLGIDLRRFAKQGNQMSPEEIFTLLNVNLQNINSLAKAYGGRLLNISGHHVMVIFEGQGSFKSALATAGPVLNSLVNQGKGTAAAVIEGEAVLGTVYLGEENIGNLLGSSVYQLEILLQEAPSGNILITRSIQEQIKNAFPDYQARGAPGAISKSKFYALKPDDANIFDIESDEDTLQSLQVIDDGQVKRIRIAPGMSLGGRYEIISELGAGGMGMVYKARDHGLNDLVALKMLKLANAEGADAFLEAMKSEIRLARKITHPSVLRTYDYGEIDGVPYISMEYVRGLTLKYLLNQSGKIPYSAGLHIVKKLTAGLQAAHAQGVLHRDIKPENVILEQNGNVKLMDFGIARRITGSGLGELEDAVIGTPSYAAPEQLEGKTIDERADIYSLGVIMFQMFTGELPYKEKSLARLLEIKTAQEPCLPSKYQGKFPKGLEKLILSCITCTQVDRLKSADDLMAALEKLRA